MSSVDSARKPWLVTTQTRAPLREETASRVEGVLWQEEWKESGGEGGGRGDRDGEHM